MGQRVRTLKNRNKSSGAAIRRTGGSNPNNTITVGNVTYRGSGKSTGNGNKVKNKRRKKKKHA